MSRFRLPLSRTVIDGALVSLAAALLVLALGRGTAGAPTIEAGTLVAADLREHALTVIDVRSGSTRRIDLPGGPHELLRLPDGRVLASLEQAGALAAIDLASGAIEEIATGGLPHGLALGDDRTLVFTDRAAHTLRRFEVGSWRELASAPVGELPHALAPLPQGGLLVASAGASQLNLNSMLVPQPALAESIAVAPRGDRVAVAGAADGRVLAYRFDGTSLFDVALGGRPVRLAYEPDGHLLAVALSAAGRVALLDERGAARYLEAPGVPDGLAFDATGRVLFVSNMAGGDVTAINVASGRVLARYGAGASAGALLLLDQP